MNKFTVGFTLALCSLAPSTLLTAADKDNFPILRVDAGGPVSFVTSLAFSPDGKVLYAAGRDKLVHAWAWSESYDGTEQFVYRPDLTWRVPVGPRFEGALNALAVSDDGRWIAAAGQGRQSSPDVAGLLDPALVWPGTAMNTQMRLDEGTIYVFDVQTREAIALREHRGAVVALKFAPQQSGKPPILVSAAEETAKTGFQGTIRVWNLEHPESSLAALGGLPSPQGRRPGLSVWHSGNKPEEVRVALAWGDNNREKQTGTFRVWDAAQKTWSVRETNPHALAVSAVPDRNLLLTAVAGDIGAWSLPSGGLLGNYQSLGKIDNRSIPLDVALLNSRPNGDVDRAAFVIATPAANGLWEVGLQAVDIGSKRLLPAAVKLWNGPLRIATVAAAPSGDFVAVSGNGQNDVLVYRTRDLLAGQAKPVQRLNGSAREQRFVAFATRDGHAGLVLNPQVREDRDQTGDVRTDDLIFDITARTLSPETNGWKIEHPNRDGWDAVPSDGEQGPALEIRKAGKRERILDLQADKEFDGVRTIDAFAVCGGTEHCPVPVVAVATQTSSLPRLSLYDMQSGQELRRFVGQLEPIHSMAFSAGGRLLATTSRDRTVAVWWLTDMAETLLGQRGLVRGLKLRDDEGQIIVDTGSAGLKPGEEITGVWLRDANGQEVDLPFPSVWDFYRFVSDQKPGDSIRLQVSGRDRPVPITIDQAIDERKPLFSLFFPGNDDISWIGWNPIGKYDAQGRDAESSLGWHFNTGEVKTPARFAASGEYRRQNFTPGLLKHLIHHGTPPATEPPTPSMSLNLTGPGDGLVYRDDNHRQMVTRTEKVMAEVEVWVSADEATFAPDMFPISNIKSLKWRLGGENEPFHEFALTADLTWEGDLSIVPWQAGVRDFVVQLETDELPPRRFEIQQQLRFQRPAPAIDLNLSKTHDRTPVKRFEFSGHIKDRADDVDVTIKRTTWKDGTPQTETLEPKRIAEKDPQANLTYGFDLAAGDNRFEVIAANVHALPGFEAGETAKSVFTVEFIESGPPVILITAIDDVDGRSGLEFPAGAVTVSRNQLKLRGTIKAEAGLEAAEMSVLRGETTASTTKLDTQFDETVTLEPGTQTIRLTALTKGGRRDQWELAVDYVPPLPQLSVTQPQPQHVTIIAPQKPQVDLRASLVSPSDILFADQQLGRASTLLVNGVSLGNLDIQPSGADPQRGELAATIDVKRGENRIELLLKNQWGSETRVLLCDVRYKVPPHIGEITLKPGEFPYAAAAFDVQSPAELGQPILSIARNGQTLPQDLYQVTVDDKEAGLWHVAADAIPLEEGPNRLTATAKNSDGQTEGRSAETVLEAPPSPPTVRLISPGTDQAIQTTRVLVAFSVRSNSPLKWVEVITRPEGKDKVVRHRLPADQLPSEKNGLGEYQLDGSLEVELEPNGASEILLEAANDGGISSPVKPVRLNVMAEPVRVVIDEIHVPASQEKPIHALFRADRTVFDRPAAEGRVQISGHVEWSPSSPPPSTRERFVCVAVNGFLRMAQLNLSKLESGQAKFQVAVVLNREQENRIRVELPRRAKELPPPYFADCEKPEKNQHLHLVVLGVARNAAGNALPAEEQQLLQEANKAFPAQNEGNSAFVSNTIHALTGENATTSSVRSEFRKIKRDIERRIVNQGRDAPAINDVVIFVYKGKVVAAADPDNFYFATHDNWVSPQSDESAISGNWLNLWFNNMPGAHLVLLETSPSNSNIAGDVNFPGVRQLPDQGTLCLLRVLQGGLHQGSDLLLAVEQSVANAVDRGEKTVQLGTLLDTIAEMPALRGSKIDAELPEDLQSLVLFRQQN